MFSIVSALLLSVSVVFSAYSLWLCESWVLGLFAGGPFGRVRWALLYLGLGGISLFVVLVLFDSVVFVCILFLWNPITCSVFFLAMYSLCIVIYVVLGLCFLLTCCLVCL